MEDLDIQLLSPIRNDDDYYDSDNLVPPQTEDDSNKRKRSDSDLDDDGSSDQNFKHKLVASDKEESQSVYVDQNKIIEHQQNINSPLGRFPKTKPYYNGDINRRYFKRPNVRSSLSRQQLEEREEKLRISQTRLDRAWNDFRKAKADFYSKKDKEINDLQILYTKIKDYANDLDRIVRDSVLKKSRRI